MLYTILNVNLGDFFLYPLKGQNIELDENLNCIEEELENLLLKCNMPVGKKAKAKIRLLLNKDNLQLVS